MDNKIIVVSGLPRCGTSLMMQMLDRGGVPVVTDHIRAADTDDRAVEVEEELLGDRGDDLRSCAVGAVVLVDDHRLAGLPHRGEDRRPIERRERPRVHDLGRGALPPLEPLRCLKARVHHEPVRDDGEVATLTLHVRQEIQMAAAATENTAIDAGHEYRAKLPARTA